jgi:hypothetical protein
MKPVFACAFLAAGAICLAGGTVRAQTAPAAEAGPPPPAKEISLEAAVPEQDAREGEGPDIVAQGRLQTAGKIVLASALAFMIAGAVLIEVDPYALKVGDWGFAMIGVGISALITSSFILGLTRPVHIGDHPLERERRRNRNADGSAFGLTVGYRRTF